jgi:hypothetical protein
VRSQSATACVTVNKLGLPAGSAHLAHVVQRQIATILFCNGWVSANSQTTPPMRGGIAENDTYLSTGRC